MSCRTIDCNICFGFQLSPWSSPASSRLPWTGSRLHPPPVDSTPIPYSPEISQELGILQSAIERASQA
ncbi:hypothetical protein MCOR05_006379 [Pyricularia oryzae]|nr:hypothetical protein MCOR05_006379 [Pyricularia oryzae]